ncbi:hypothetical protein [Ferrovibrio terrae]|uniref:hypothetical protein n=1 Tax=Ferrovibrio terrae TaxID=2594003 RepID=UPI003137A788
MAMPMHPTTLPDYLDLAKLRADLRNDATLAAKLGITRTSLSQMRSGLLWPGDPLMLKIADLAREDGPMALLMLNSWRAKDAFSKSAWDELLARFRQTAAAILIAIGISAVGAPIGGATSANAAPTSGHAAQAHCILWKI